MKKLLTKEQLEAIEACASNVENFDTCLGCPANDGEIDFYRDPARTAIALMNENEELKESVKRKQLCMDALIATRR